MRNLKYFLIVALLITIISGLSGCGFKPRRPSDFPEKLHTLYLDSSQPNKALTVDLRRTLKALRVHFVNSPKKAPIILKLSDINYQYVNPNVISTITAVSYGVSLQVTVTLLDAKKKPITTPHTIVVSRTVILNVNQILVPNILQEAARNLTREAVNDIYYWLISEKTHRALSDYERKDDRHATQSKTTCQSS